MNSQKTIQDKCIGLRFVEEGMCNSINQGRIKVLKCASNEVCKDGACTASPEKCIDTDGDKRETKGTVSFVTKSGIAGTFNDLCSTPSYLIEGMCKGSMFMSRGVQCPSGTGCKDGACVTGVSAVPITCTDSDGGFNANLKGVTQAGTKKSEDYCTDTRTLQEYYCYQNQIYSLSRICYEGACSNGICTTIKSTQSSTGSSPSSGSFRSSWSWGR